jgi:hypothetical protein
MRRTLQLPLVILANLLAIAPAFAVLEPLSEPELTDKSDVVALVRVLSVTCTSVYPDPQTGDDLCTYLAKLQVLEAKKGEAKKGNEMILTWRAYPKGALDLYAINYYPGEEVWTHLKKRSGGVSYETVAPNGKGDPVKAPESRDLPTGIGETFVATPEPQKQTPL